jgi:hypothetical protein
MQRYGISARYSRVKRRVSCRVREEDALCCAAVCGEGDGGEAGGDRDGGHNDGLDHCFGLAVRFDVRFCYNTDGFIVGTMRISGKSTEVRTRMTYLTGAMLKIGVAMSDGAKLDHLVMTVTASGAAWTWLGFTRCKVIVFVRVSVLCRVTVVVGSAELAVSPRGLATTEVMVGVTSSVMVTVT